MKNFRSILTKYPSGGCIHCTEKEGMEMGYDARKEERVWQRVCSEKQEEHIHRQMENLPALIMEQLQLSAVYRQLASRINGKDGAVLIRLAREANTQAVCLKGIVALMKGSVPQTCGAPQPITGTEAILRRCYGTELRLMKAYENRNADEEYGPVFERMAARGREHCCALLELIGKTGKAEFGIRN